MADTAHGIKRWDQRVDWTSNELSTRLMVVGMKQEIAELRAALASRPAEVDDEGRTGYKLVPIEPTPEMIEAFTDHLTGACGSFFEWFSGGDQGYKAMIEAAPSRTTNKEK